jgi:hypothetical protein
MAKLDLTDIPNHMEVKEDTIISDGLYKRGAVFDISCEGEYMVEGKLYGSDQKPIALVSGYAIHTTNKEADPVQFFTNEDGEFVINNLVLGKYTVRVNFEGCKDFEIEVKDSETHISNLGKIICEKEINDDNEAVAAESEAAATNAVQEAPSEENPGEEYDNSGQNTTQEPMPDNSSVDTEATSTTADNATADNTTADNTTYADATSNVLAIDTTSLYFDAPKKLPATGKRQLLVECSSILPTFHNNLGRA